MSRPTSPRPDHPPQAPALIAVDWGSSSLRGALLDGEGQVLDERHAAEGILHLAPGGFARAFEHHFGDWLRHGLPSLICGMAGSRQGWMEVPYAPCPASFEQLAAQIQDLPGLPWRVGLVPGLSWADAEVPDVMRGEETQVLGALRRLQLQRARLVLPGTHSKWVEVDGGRITRFQTWMSGEFYALLSQQSLLARTLQADAPLDDAPFLAGVRQAHSGPSLLHTAFGTRTLGLLAGLPPAAQASYLSGLVIGEELRHQQLVSGQTLYLIGAPALTERYALALGRMHADVRCSCHGNELTWSGLFGLHQAREAGKDTPP